MSGSSSAPVRQVAGFFAVVAVNAILTLCGLAQVLDLLLCVGIALAEWAKLTLLKRRALSDKDNNVFPLMLKLEGFSFGAVAVILLSVVSSQMSVFSILLWVLDFIACRIFCAFAIGDFLYEKK